MDKYALNLDSFIMLMETVMTHHYEERVKERLDDKLKMFDTDGLSNEVNVDAVNKYLSQQLTDSFTKGIMDMHVPDRGLFGLRSGRVVLSDKAGTHHPIFKIEGEDGQTYVGDEFVAVLKNGSLTTVKLINHDTPDARLGMDLALHDKKLDIAAGKPVQKRIMPYNVVAIKPEFAVDLNDMRFKLFGDKFKSGGVKSIRFVGRDTKEMTFAPGRMVTRDAKVKQGEEIVTVKKTSEVLDYELPGRNETLTLYLKGEGSTPSMKRYSVGDIAKVTPSNFSAKDMMKMEAVLGEEVDYDKIDYSTVEFQGKVTETGLYTDKPKQKYTNTQTGAKIDKPVPFIRVEVSDISFNTK